MFWSKKVQPSLKGMELSEICRLEAEALFRSGKYNCAEAVVEVIRKHFSPQIPEAVVGLVSGFGGGSGSGCICGAVAAGTVALGLALGEKKKTTQLTRELHTWFKEMYGATCCKTIRATHDKGICPVLTGVVAGKIAEMLSRKKPDMEVYLNERPVDSNRHIDFMDCYSKVYFAAVWRANLNVQYLRPRGPRRQKIFRQG